MTRTSAVENASFANAPDWAVDIRNHDNEGLCWTDGIPYQSQQIEQTPEQGCGPMVSVPIYGYESQYSDLFSASLKDRVVA